MVDDHSQLAYSEVLPDETGRTCAGFLERASAHFAEHARSRIERVMTDSAFAYKNSAVFQAAVAGLGARQKFIRSIAHGRTARSRDSIARWLRNGPMRGGGSPVPSALRASLSGSRNTTLGEATPRPEELVLPLGCQQRDGRVHLDPHSSM